jgi:hypothetical protein
LKEDATKVYHYTSFSRAHAILKGVGLDPNMGQPCCHEFRPGRFQRGLRALVEPDPASWRASPVFGDYISLLMRLIEDRLCLEVAVTDDEAVVVERAAVEGYMYGLGSIALPGRLPADFRFFSRVSSEEAMWQSRVPPSRHERWAAYLLPKVIITSPIAPARILISREQPYLLDPRWVTETTRRRASEFDIPPFPEIWERLMAAQSL